MFSSKSQIRHPHALAAMQRLKPAAKVYLSKLRLLATLADQDVQAAAGFFLFFLLPLTLFLPVSESVRSEQLMAPPDTVHAFRGATAMTHKESPTGGGAAGRRGRYDGISKAKINHTTFRFLKFQIQHPTCNLPPWSWINSPVLKRD